MRGGIARVRRVRAALRGGADPVVVAGPLAGPATLIDNGRRGARMMALEGEFVVLIRSRLLVRLEAAHIPAPLALRVVLAPPLAVILPVLVPEALARPLGIPLPPVGLSFACRLARMVLGRVSLQAAILAFSEEKPLPFAFPLAFPKGERLVVILVVVSFSAARLVCGAGRALPGLVLVVALDAPDVHGRAAGHVVMDESHHVLLQLVGLGLSTFTCASEARRYTSGTPPTCRPPF